MCLAFMPKAAALVLLAVSVAHAWADDKTEYDKRAVARYMQLFQSLDRNADGVVTREEAQGDLNLGPRFDDMDVNRDGRVTSEELHGYLERHHGMLRQGAAAALFASAGYVVLRLVPDADNLNDDRDGGAVSV